MTSGIPDLRKVRLQTWDNPAFPAFGVHADVLRLDTMHPVISGNKWFKLKYYLERARETHKSKLVSMGGPYSNHLVALAAAAKAAGLSAAAYIRGEAPVILSHTLAAAKKDGLELRFIPRDMYRNLRLQIPPADSETDTLFVPEGGAGAAGVRGAREILQLLPSNKYTHICLAVGTGTTMAGIINGANPQQQIIGVSVLKGMQGTQPLPVSFLDEPHAKNFRMIQDAHFGGYAKSSRILFDYMNRIYTESRIPTDFVYTGKLFYAIERLVIEKAFAPGSRLLLLHTGGLQGNESLDAGVLQY